MKPNFGNSDPTQNRHLSSEEQLPKDMLNKASNLCPLGLLVTWLVVIH